MLSDQAELKLRGWLGPSTWSTPDANDMGRWYDFVDQYHRDHGYTIKEDALCEYIEHQIEGGVNEHLRETICKRISLAYDILDFLKRTGR